MQEFPGIIIVFVSLVVLVLGVFCLLFAARRRLGQSELIKAYVFPEGVLEGFRQHHRDLGSEQIAQVQQALRQFFMVRLRVGNRLIGMPSKVVDDLWHEFILDTREYEKFCRKAFGRFFHHVPAAASPAGEMGNAALRVTWRHACLGERMSPDKPSRLPLLFRIDTELQIAGATSYLNWLFASPMEKRNGWGDSACGGGSSGCCGHGCGGGGCGGH